MNGVYMPKSAQCPVCGRILPTYEDAQAEYKTASEILDALGLLPSQGLCACPIGAVTPGRGLRRRVDPSTGEMFDMPGLRHRDA